MFHSTIRTAHGARSSLLTFLHVLLSHALGRALNTRCRTNREQPFLWETIADIPIEVADVNSLCAWTWERLINMIVLVGCGRGPSIGAHTRTRANVTWRGPFWDTAWLAASHPRCSARSVRRAAAVERATELLELTAEDELIILLDSASEHPHCHFVFVGAGHTDSWQTLDHGFTGLLKKTHSSLSGRPPRAAHR